MPVYNLSLPISFGNKENEHNANVCNLSVSTRDEEPPIFRSTKF